MKKKKKVAAGPRGTKNENTQYNENASNGKRDFDDEICFEEKMEETTRPWRKEEKKRSGMGLGASTRNIT